MSLVGHVREQQVEPTAVSGSLLDRGIHPRLILTSDTIPDLRERVAWYQASTGRPQLWVDYLDAMYAANARGVYNEPSDRAGLTAAYAWLASLLPIPGVTPDYDAATYGAWVGTLLTTSATTVSHYASTTLRSFPTPCPGDRMPYGTVAGEADYSGKENQFMTVGFAYDWAYHWLTSVQREMIGSSLNFCGTARDAATGHLTNVNILHEQGAREIYMRGVIGASYLGDVGDTTGAAAANLYCWYFHGEEVTGLGRMPTATRLISRAGYCGSGLDYLVLGGNAGNHTLAIEALRTAHSRTWAEVWEDADETWDYLRKYLWHFLALTPGYCGNVVAGQRERPTVKTNRVENVAQNMWTNTMVGSGAAFNARFFSVEEPELSAVAQYLIDRGDMFRLPIIGSATYGYSTTAVLNEMLKLPAAAVTAQDPQTVLPLHHEFPGVGVLSWRSHWDFDPGSDMTLVTLHNPPYFYQMYMALACGGFSLDRRGPILPTGGTQDAHRNLAPYFGNLVCFWDPINDVQPSNYGDTNGCEFGTQVMGYSPTISTTSDYSQIDSTNWKRGEGWSRQRYEPTWFYASGDVKGFYSGPHNVRTDITSRCRANERSVIFVPHLSPTDSDFLVIHDRCYVTSTAIETRWRARMPGVVAALTTDPTARSYAITVDGSGSVVPSTPSRGDGTRDAGRQTHLRPTEVRITYDEVNPKSTLGTRADPSAWWTPLLPEIASRQIVEVAGPRLSDSKWTTDSTAYGGTIPLTDVEQAFELEIPAGVQYRRLTSGEYEGWRSWWSGSGSLELMTTTPQLTTRFFNVIEAGPSGSTTKTPVTHLTATSVDACRVQSWVFVFGQGFSFATVPTYVTSATITVDAAGTHVWVLTDLQPSTAYTLTDGTTTHSGTSDAAGTWSEEVVSDTGTVWTLSI